MAIRMMFVHALTSLHAGTGQGVGAIDLPIARERATDLPLVPGSSIKGCLKDRHGEGNESLFGKEDAAGLLQISDARLLLLPLRSLGATFVWATSPYVLRRLKRDSESVGLADASFPAIPDVADGQARVATVDCLVELGGQRKLVLEELDFMAAIEALKWSEWLGSRLFPSDRDWQQEFNKRFAIIDDKSFHHLARFGTEVNAHVRIGANGIVEAGALWYQESLPAETVLVSLFRTEARKGSDAGADAKLALISAEQYLQMGGKATTGQGMVRLAPAGGKQ
jgi:CRISPR-associated protein Cmr4